MPGYKTAFQGYAVAYSPFENGKIAVATSQNFGIIGNGKQYVLEVRMWNDGQSSIWFAVLIVVLQMEYYDAERKKKSCLFYSVDTMILFWEK